MDTAGEPDWDEIWREASIAARKWRNYHFHDDLVQVAALSLHKTHGEHLARRRMIARSRCIDEVRRWQGKVGSNAYDMRNDTMHLEFELYEGTTIADIIGDDDSHLCELVDWVQSTWKKPEHRAIAAGVILRMKKEDIAEMLGVSPSMVSIHIQKMRKKNRESLTG